MLVYPSGVDVSGSALRFPSARLRRHRRVIGSCRRRLSAGRQALLALAHLRMDTHMPSSQPDSESAPRPPTDMRPRPSRLLAGLAPTLADATRTAATKAFVILDGTLLPIDRIAALVQAILALHPAGSK